MYRIEKTMSNDIELLPDIADTSLIQDFEAAGYSTHNRKTKTLIALLYHAISQRENYYQTYTPTAYGDPQYKYYCGLVIGILQASGMCEVTEDEYIVIKKNNRRLLIIDKIKRPQSYYDACKEISKTMRALGL